ncbi:membrane lipoprotein lipid attachment site-containing protein [Nitratireductor indicus]|uniref:Uncharacterized protein n=1 Tax=Nitratireductor indicus C115 TaxID=1231190 RepID=K2NZP7_9HYPH|nr:membrane lipoprotein lipid attachment site-containing protein [Nitratireductor indicus]EKF43409.1 hypothetical protein NA8A_05238 [Nitratireductor indicus C115]MDS1135734.1 membrane lipoprotein lipid attachment site-containing protein [Nitratireductor indicus]SFQ08217.1 hypothetical protein SAMN05216176_101257 [Nitratireductor indicus]
MKKILIAAVSGFALLGLAACSEGDNTTTQSVEPTQQDTAPMEQPSATPDATAPDATGTAPQGQDTMQQ